MWIAAALLLVVAIGSALALVATRDLEERPAVARATDAPTARDEPPRLAAAPPDASPPPAAAPVPASSSREPIVAGPAPRREKASGRGRLKVNLIPWADVRIDGGAAVRTPVDVLLPAGRHEIALHNPDTGHRARRNVTIVADRTLEITDWER
jgi:hypothetical protein